MGSAKRRQSHASLDDIADRWKRGKIDVETFGGVYLGRQATIGQARGVSCGERTTEPPNLRFDCSEAFCNPTRDPSADLPLVSREVRPQRLQHSQVVERMDIVADDPSQRPDPSAVVRRFWQERGFGKPLLQPFEKRQGLRQYRSIDFKCRNQALRVDRQELFRTVGAVRRS
jgi:hypothetical protein